MNKLINRAYTNIRRNGWRAIAILFMMTVTYVILGIFIIALFLSRSVANHFIRQAEIIGFFKDGITEEKILEIKRGVEELDYVVNVEYVSKEDALKSFIEENKNKTDLVQSITVNPFPAHLNVKVNSLDKVGPTADYFRQNDAVDEVVAAEVVVDTLKRIVNGIQNFGIALMVIFTISTFIVIFLMIGITIYSQKDELIIMKLVGATNWYIRLPYILQSLAYGLLSSLIAAVILVIAVVFGYKYLVTGMLGISSLRDITAVEILIGVGSQIAYSVFLSIASSYIATKRYIKN